VGNALQAIQLRDHCRCISRRRIDKAWHTTQGVDWNFDGFRKRATIQRLQFCFVVCRRRLLPGLLGVRYGAFCCGAVYLATEDPSRGGEYDRVVGAEYLNVPVPMGFINAIVVYELPKNDACYDEHHEQYNGEPPVNRYSGPVNYSVAGAD
jgi:hypothetical protein